MFRFLALSLMASAAVAADHVVINEINYQPPDKKPLEFIELLNAGDQPAHLDGWTLDGFKFPAGTVLASGAFVVVAEDPVALEKEFGVKSLGPLPERLSNDGEKVALQSADGKVVDQVDYRVGFPWPSASAGGGSSIERLHPFLDGNQPAHWRASGFPASEHAKSAALLPAGSAQWRWRKGTSEASTPVGAWRLREFREGADWQTGKAGFGYGDDDDATVINDMQGHYTTIFLRHRVMVAKVPAALTLRVRVDDGCIIWINGREAARFHAPAGEPRFDSLGQDHEAGDWEIANIANAAQFLVPGENLIAAQVFNESKDSSDLSFDLSVEDAANPAGPAAALSKRPTPGATNSVFLKLMPPVVSGVKHLPLEPRPGEPVRIMASTTRGTVKTATLHVQIVEPGAYVRKSDPDYQTRWQDIPMRYENSEWVADIPGEQQKSRRLVRYRISVESPDGAQVRVPYPDDPVQDFAYFVWAGPPAWTATPQPGKPPITFSPDMQRTLPNFTLIANAQDVQHSQWDGGANHHKFLGTFIYEGRVYDHIQFNNRGSASTYVNGKNKWGFHFPPGHELAMRDQWGRLYKATWNSFAMNGCASPWVQINRGMAGLDEAISFRAYQVAGVPASDCLPVCFRVVTTPEEQGKTQYDGDLWGLYQAIEDTDGAWLDNHHLHDGIVFKPEDGVKHKVSGSTIDPNTVWHEFQNGPRGGDAVAWWRQHMDMAVYDSFHSINRLVSNVDLRPGANHAFYQDPKRGWQPVPWDLDMEFIPRTHQPGYIDQAGSLQQAALKLEFQNRAREVLDLLGSDPSPTGGQIGQLVAEYARLIEPAVGKGSPEWSWAMLDMCRWNYAPQTNDKGAFYRSPTSQGMMGGMFTRTLATPNFAGFCKYIVDFCTDSRAKKDYQPNDGNPLGYGFGHLLSECRDNDVPERPTIKRTGGVTFAVSPFADPQGPTTFGAIQWRLAEIGTPVGGPWKYEIQPTWLSEPLPATGVTSTLPAGLCYPGRIYRVRARYEDNTGRWGHWSEPVQVGP